MFSIFFQIGSDGRQYIDWLWDGLIWTLVLSFSGWCLAFLVGVFIGVGRTVTNRYIRAIARFYVEVFRNIPVLVQMFLWYFVLPELLPMTIGNWVKQMPPPWGAFFPALLCLTFYTAARVAEQVRAGLEALPIGQSQASAALGFNQCKTYFYILVPQALRLIVPSLTSEVMSIYKNTSVALTIGLLELTARARQVSEETFQTFSAYGFATILYLGLALIVYRWMLAIDRKYAIPGSDAAKSR
ncbi:L-glutamate ABC transporter membrane protein /L-aspartate ABC transporter membrane protein [Bartonella apihabitans]|uniref:amino acid ABC transporter permease n=1 Tax=Bartonella apihabitans TaxID=2750929 RepID=UPI00098F9CC8|nr:amino acid ABC transporter permease [Bartonella apihabitans]AQT45387.1 L-glutamate ABC transporter membrane protein /L-aspartate ABC transporter membrane protein [Bartonella apihabitans]